MAEGSSETAPTSVTEDGGVNKSIVREGRGPHPPLHARCLGQASLPDGWLTTSAKYEQPLVATVHYVESLR